MHPPIISRSTPSSKITRHSNSVEPAWIAEQTIPSRSDSPVLLTTAAQRDSSGYIWLLLLALLSVAGYLVKTRMTQMAQSPTQPASPPSRRSSAPAAPTQHPLHLRLVQLLNGDENAADRLLRHSHLTHPNRAPHWHYERVIEDSLRDRR